MKYPALFMLLIPVFFACSKESADKTLKFVINPATEGLDVALSVKLENAEGKVTSVKTSWGDPKADTYMYGPFDGFTVSHIYDLPGTYNITLTANDDLNAVLSDSIQVDIGYKPTSLAGIKSSMYKTSPDEYLILTLNLHTYQESRQNEKFNLIADVIGMMDVDFIAFQECAQNRNTAISEGNIRTDNMAKIIAGRIMEKFGKTYYFKWDWAHYGWEVWEEGVAVLSKYPITAYESRYISSLTTVTSIESRKVIFVSCQAGNSRVFNLFSAHTHWRTSLTSEEQNNQVKKIKLMVEEKEGINENFSPISLVCGDFNGNPTSDDPWSEGYQTMMQGNSYCDTFLEIYPDANNKPAQSRYNTIGGEFPGRIDYIFMKKDSLFYVFDSQIIFKPDVVGVVSDHYGVMTKIKYIR